MVSVTVFSTLQLLFRDSCVSASVQEQREGDGAGQAWAWPCSRLSCGPCERGDGAGLRDQVFCDLGTDPGPSLVCTRPARLSRDVPRQPRKARGAQVDLSWLVFQSFETFHDFALLPDMVDSGASLGSQWERICLQGSSCRFDPWV